jgi:aminopeptidase Y
MAESMDKRILIILGIIGLFGLITFALVAATLGTLNKRLDTVESKLSLPAPTLTTTTRPPVGSTLATSINIEEILGYLRELQNIANASNGTRAINTLGFNMTLDFIHDYLTTHTNFNVTKTFFHVRDFALDGNPILISSNNGITKNYTYSSNPAAAEFLHVKYSTLSNISNVFNLTVIPNGGCTEADWQNANPPPAGSVALIKRGGSCTFADRAAQAPKFAVVGLLFYNDGTLPDRFSPIEVSLGQDNTLPALFLSYNAGQALADAVNTSTDVTVQLGINLRDLPAFPVGNICADTPTGDVTQTIVIGSHSDSVPAGPGINDNGKLLH